MWYLTTEAKHSPLNFLGLTSPKFPVASLLRSAASNSGGGSASTLFAKLMKASCKSAVLSFRKSFCRPDHQLSSCKPSEILLDVWTSTFLLGLQSFGEPGNSQKTAMWSKTTENRKLRNYSRKDLFVILFSYVRKNDFMMKVVFFHKNQLGISRCHSVFLTLWLS